MSSQVYRFATFTVDVGAHALLKRDTRLPIQEQPFQVLLALLDKAGQVVTREALCRRLWGTTTFVDFDQSLNSAVRRLRLALEDDSRDPVFVETLPRLGFRFLAEVDAEEAAGTQDAGTTGLRAASRAATGKTYPAAEAASARLRPG